MALEGIQFSHYHLLTLIGKGGMGEVYLAEDTKIQRQVAVKLIRIETLQTDQQGMASALRLFWREATAIGRLDHPSILPLYDHGETEIQGLDVAYLILPYRPEGSLSAWLRKRGQARQTRQLTLKQVVHVIRQASQGLQYAHDRSIMHLDVKPANFLIRSRSEDDEYPDLLLSDFGIARLTGATSSSSQHVSGTPTYMAPEQCTGQPVMASDQYALAIMAYELLTGSPPFQGPPMKVLFAHVQQPPEPARARNPAVPSVVDQVVQRALAKKPEERFSSITTFAQAFQQAFEGVPEESTLRLLPLTSVSPTPDAASVPAPVPHNAALPASTLQPAHPFPSVSVVAPSQEKITLPSTAPVSVASVSIPRTPMVPAQPARASASSATLPPSPTPTRPNRRRSVVRVGGLLLLILVMVAGGILGIWRVFPKTVQANSEATATALMNSNATATARASVPGRMWHVQASGTSSVLRSVAWSGSQFVAVGDNGTILTSPDGRTWTPENSGTPLSLGSVAWSGSQFIAVGADGTILTSPDGRTWTNQKADTSSALSGVVWSGSQFIAVGWNGIILTSS